MPPTHTSQIVQNRLQIRAMQLHETAETLPHGHEREGILDRARRMKNASLVIDRWMASSDLRAPS
jgi:hypothetical protein